MMRCGARAIETLRRVRVMFGGWVLRLAKFGGNGFGNELGYVNVTAGAAHAQAAGQIGGEIDGHPPKLPAVLPLYRGLGRLNV